MFNPARLTLARKRRGLTKRDLAEAVGVTPHTILRYEDGEMVPSEEVLGKLASVLAFPPEFFFDADVHELQEGAASFRSLSTISSKDREAAVAAGRISFL